MSKTDITTLPVMDISQGKEDFGDEMFLEMVANFESSTFDSRMRQMLDGMLEKDWAKAMVAAHTMKGSSGYIYAQRFLNSCKQYQEHIKKECERIEYDATLPVDPNRPGYRILPTFDTKKQLQAYEYFFPFMDEAMLLKSEMSRLTGSKYSNDLYSEEGKILKKYKRLVKIIKKYYEKLRKGGNTNTLDERQGTLKSIGIQQSLQRLPSQNNAIKQTGGSQKLIQQPEIVIDEPKNVKCCEKCQIF